MSHTKPQNEPCSPVCPQGDCANCVDFAAKRAHANDILNRLKEGEPVARKIVDWALRMTGDSVTTFGHHNPSRAHLGAAA